jgi:hypothetical protein
MKIKEIIEYLSKFNSNKRLEITYDSGVSLFNPYSSLEDLFCDLDVDQDGSVVRLHFKT